VLVQLNPRAGVDAVAVPDMKPISRHEMERYRLWLGFCGDIF
jgi:hypothetical protein